MAAHAARPQAKREDKITPKPEQERFPEDRKGHVPNRNDTRIERARISSNQEISSSMKSPRHEKTLSLKLLTADVSGT